MNICGIFFKPFAHLFDIYKTFSWMFIRPFSTTYKEISNSINIIFCWRILKYYCCLFYFFFPFYLFL